MKFLIFAFPMMLVCCKSNVSGNVTPDSNDGADEIRHKLSKTDIDVVLSRWYIHQHSAYEVISPMLDYTMHKPWKLEQSPSEVIEEQRNALKHVLKIDPHKNQINLKSEGMDGWIYVQCEALRELSVFTTEDLNAKQYEILDYKVLVGLLDKQAEIINSVYQES